MLYYNANVFVDGRFIRGGFSVEKGRFADVFAGEPKEKGTDLQGAYVIPGLVDIRVHGSGGADFSDGSYDGLVHMGRCLAKQGVTAFAPTIAQLPFRPVELAMSTAVMLRRDRPEGCAWLAGAHMEGPLLSQNGKPDFRAFRSLYDFMGGIISVVDVAPEQDGAAEFIRQVKDLCTVMDEETAMTELVCDADHVLAAFRQFPGRICLVSDARRDRGTDLYTGLRRAVTLGVPKEEAILSATLIPAQRIGVDYEVGSIAKNKRADFILCDDNLERKQVFLAGKPVG